MDLLIEGSTRDLRCEMLRNFFYEVIHFFESLFDSGLIANTVKEDRKGLHLRELLLLFAFFLMLARNIFNF